MPSKPSTTIAARRQEALKTNFGGMAPTEGNHDQAENKSAQAAQDAQDAKTGRKGYIEKQRAERDKSAVLGDRVFTMNEGTSEPSGAEPDDIDNARAPSQLSDTDTTATEPLLHVELGRTLTRLPTVPRINVPILAHYELRGLPSANDHKDDNDQGVFAVQMIERGTRIISERPVLTLTAPGDQLDELMLAYENLSKVNQEKMWNLRPAASNASEQLASLRFLTDRLAFDLQNIIFKPAATRTIEEQKTLDGMLPKLQKAMNVWRIAARWHANRCSMTDLPMDQRSSLPRGTPITGLFIERAHIRHSCVPNCFASFDTTLGRMNVHVTRNIAAGEELTLSAFADNMYYSVAEDRKEGLSVWGLTCECEACDPQHPKFKSHEEARQRAHTRAVLLTDVLTRLESEELTEHELDTAQSTVFSLIRDLKATGCENPELVRWRNILVDRILPARALIVSESDKALAWQVILMHASECEKLGEVCYGADREEVRVLRATREGCENAVEMMKMAVGEGRDGDE
ncbi:TPR domain-containing protein [Stagonosporopsis vannaccii]|nr:TPR domain-containing protein [Stagonosporopsis vannaccii]